MNKSLNILLIINDDNMNELMTEGLESHGFKVEAFTFTLSSFPQGLIDILNKKKYDIIIPTNFYIPFQYVPQQIEIAKAYGNDAGIIVLSGYVEEGFIEKYTQLPKIAFVKSPFSWKHLFATIYELSNKDNE